MKYKNYSSFPHQLITRENSLYLGEIEESPQIKERTIKLILRLRALKSNNKWAAGYEKIIIYLQKDHLSKKLNTGDIICFKGSVKNVPTPKNPFEFNFKRYLSFHFIHHQAYIKTAQWKLIKKDASVNLYVIADKLRESLIGILKKKGIKNDELAIVSALVLGYKDNINVQLKNAYSSAGAMHVLAVSGLHVGIIFLLFNSLLSFLKKYKYGLLAKGIMLIILLWSYALITGLSASVMRSAMMFSFIIAAKMMNRNSGFFNTLAASAFTLLIYNPLLIMEVGFQLSYLAVAGIVIIQPWINNWFSLKWWLPKKIWEITAVSIAAQITTFPLGLLYFHQFPNYFILSNLVVIPLAIAILYLGLATLCLSFIPLIGEYFAIALNYMVKFLNHIVHFIDNLPYSLSRNIRFNTFDTWMVYLTISSLIMLIANRKFRFLFSGSVFFIAFMISRIWFNYHISDQKKIIIYNIPKHTTINFIDPEKNILIADNELIKDRGKLLFHVQNNWINNGVNTEKMISLTKLSDCRTHYDHLYINHYYIQFYNYRIAIVNEKLEAHKVKQRLYVDLLIVTKNTKLSIEELLTLFDAKMIVIDASNPFYSSKKIMQKTIGVKCWPVIKKGAYQVSL